MHSLAEMSGALTTERMGRAATAVLHCGQRGSVLTSLTSTVSSAAQPVRQGPSLSSYWGASACLTMWSVNPALASPKPSEASSGAVGRQRADSAALWFVPLWLSAVSARQLIQEPVHHADAWAHSLVEQLRVGRAWMRPGGREFFGVLDFFSHVDELLMGDV
jgi:hypothetical protein